MQLKVLSWNIWIDGNFRQMRDFLRSADADVIALQEVKDDDPERPIIPFLNELGYKSVFMPVEKVWGDKVYRDGLAIFSKMVNADPSNAPTWSMHPGGCPKCNPQGVDTRLDYIFASKDISFSGAKVGHAAASDHLPIFVTIQL